MKIKRIIYFSHHISLGVYSSLSSNDVLLIYRRINKNKLFHSCILKTNTGRKNQAEFNPRIRQ